ncbi:MAG: HupE/UreJ family protein [Rubripirellula sp.]
MRLGRSIAAATTILLGWNAIAAAHDVGVAFVELQETPSGSYVLTAGAPPAVAHRYGPPVLPDRFELAEGPASTRQIQMGQLRYEFSAPDSRLTATDELLLDWPRVGAMVKIRWQDGTTVNRFFPRTTGGIPIDMSMLQAGSGSLLDTAWRYTNLGTEHILLGIDHLLFVLGLLLIVRDGWTLVKTITSFTVAHSVTLALATLGIVQVQPKAVDTLIALSIVFLAVEIMHAREGRKGLTVTSPWIVAFAFGLLHGLGFAGALNELGLPQSEIPAALLFFNVGVEIGQMIFVLAFLLLRWSFRRLEVHWPRWSEPLPAYAIGTFAMCWFLGRATLIIPGPWSG